jgi:hypothetical protein
MSAILLRLTLSAVISGRSAYYASLLLAKSNSPGAPRRGGLSPTRGGGLRRAPRAHPDAVEVLRLSEKHVCPDVALSPIVFTEKVVRR